MDKPKDKSTKATKGSSDFDDNPERAVVAGRKGGLASTNSSKSNVNEHKSGSKAS